MGVRLNGFPASMTEITSDALESAAAASLTSALIGTSTEGTGEMRAVPAMLSARRRRVATKVGPFAYVLENA